MSKNFPQIIKSKLELDFREKIIDSLHLSLDYEVFKDIYDDINERIFQELSDFDRIIF